MESKGINKPGARAAPDCDELNALLPAHSIGATDRDEAASVERTLEQGACPGADEEMAAYRALAGRLAAEAPPAEPPTRLRDLILDAARRTPQVGAQRAGGKNRPLQFVAPHPGGLRLTLGLVAAVVILFVGAVWALSELSWLRANSEWLAERVERQSALIETFQAADAQLVRLPPAADGQNTSATALVIWAPSLNQGMLMADKFPELGEGKTFQAWVTRGDEIISLGTFRINAEGAGYLVLPADLLDAPFDALGVTMEPAGGSERPTSKPVVRLEVAQD